MRSIAFACVVVAALALAGCAAHRPTSLASRFVHRGEPAMKIGGPALPARPPEDSLATFIEKVRALSAAARPHGADRAATIEGANEELRDALAREAAQPSPKTHRRVGEVYMRLGVLDLAYERFSMAVRADSRDGEAYERIARIWRDWGFAHLALGDAYRAIYYAPSSPSAYNTLGTVFQALGHPDQALAAYRQALALAPDAAYALNNVCSALLQLRRPSEALPNCERATQLDSTLAAAQQNLAAARRAVEAGEVISIVGAADSADAGGALPTPLHDTNRN